MNGALLDTHTFIWLVTGDEPLARKSLELIKSTKASNKLYFSPISIWEIAMLVSKKRLQIKMSLSHWFSQAFAKTGIQLAELSTAVMLESCALPGDFHADPADRMIVATARVENLILVTRDNLILSYAEQDMVSACKA